MRHIGHHGHLSLFLLLCQFLHRAEKRVVALYQRENLMQNRLVSRHEEGQVAEIVLFVIDAVVVDDELVAEPHVVMRARQLVGLTAEKRDWHIRKSVQADLRRGFRAIELHISLCPVVKFLELPLDQDLSVVLATHVRGPRREVPQVILESFVADLADVLVAHHRDACCGRSGQPQKPTHELTAYLGRGHHLRAHFFQHFDRCLVFSHRFNGGVLAPIHSCHWCEHNE
mmetsp:Transcript_31291/g.41403  ORF Transcript_31291/g.41403 Transcript_31291/m.41403 type:complete len:228 (+) Transcript_31291:118-801(+)